MVKLIYLFRRNPNMSHDEFKAYYEDEHLKLFEQYLALPDLGKFISRHVRRYLTPVKDRMSGVTRADCDAILEIWFCNRESYEGYLESPLDEEFRKIVIADEERFLDRAHTQCYVVDECDAPIPDID